MGSGPVAEPSANKDASAQAGGRSRRGWWVLGGFLALLAAFWLSGANRYLSYDMLRDHHGEIEAWVAANHVGAAVIFILIYVVAVSFSLPGASWLTITGGFLFGTLAATLYVVVGATLGAVAVFWVVRALFADFCLRRWGGNIARLQQGFQADALSYLLFLRLFPLFPFWLVNLAAAAFDVSLRAYVVATFFGIIPGTFVYASLGGGLAGFLANNEKPDLGAALTPEVMLPLAALAVLSLLPALYRRWKKKQGA